MWRTRAGYAGGTKESPTYEAIGDHSECYQVDFDPEVVSYEQLLDMFWESHDATAKTFSNQYASLILVHDDEQLAAAEASLKRYEAATGRRVMTKIERIDRFYPAEDYHQKHELRNEADLMREFAAMYPDQVAFRDSTAAARVNGFLGGYGSADLLATEIDSYGLTDAAEEQLERSVGTGEAACPLPTP